LAERKVQPLFEEGPFNLRYGPNGTNGRLTAYMW
jgi:hypothetical protein